MNLSSLHYERFLANLRSNLIGHQDPVSTECLSYLAQATRLQIELLPRYFYWVFIFVLNLLLLILTCTPSFLHRRVLQILRKSPGFSSVLYYHEKIAAAAELEFFSKGKIQN